jgi:LysR family transcriptional regulator, transcriptional activator of the cysJI operon
MTLRHFTAFATVASHLNITKAALALRMSQPAVSKLLKALEENYNVTLFTRTGKGIELTDDGGEFLKCIEPILAQLQTIEARFSKTSDSKKATPLRVGGTHALSSSVLSSLLALFKKRCPDVEVVLRSNTASILEQMILKGHLEIAFTSILPRSAELTVEFCAALKLVAFAAKAYPIAQEKQLSLADLEKIPLIIRDDGSKRGTTESLLLKLRSLGYRPNIVMRCESPEAIKTAVSKKLGVGILYHEVLKDAFAQGLFKQIHVSGLSIEGKTYVVCHKQRPLSSSGEAFVEILRHWCETKRTTVRNTKAHPVVSVVYLLYAANELLPTLSLWNL